MAPSSGSCGLFTQGNGRFAVTHPGNTPGEGAEPGEAPLRHKEGATRVPSEGRDAPRGASRTQGAKKASGVRGRRVRTGVRERGLQVSRRPTPASRATINLPLCRRGKLIVPGVVQCLTRGLVPRTESEEGFGSKRQKGADRRERERAASLGHRRRKTSPTRITHHPRQN